MEEARSRALTLFLVYNQRSALGSRNGGSPIKGIDTIIYTSLRNLFCYIEMEEARSRALIKLIIIFVFICETRSPDELKDVIEIYRDYFVNLQICMEQIMTSTFCSHTGNKNHMNMSYYI